MTAATGLVINGARVLVPGLRIVNFYDDPTLRLRMPGTGKPADGRPRRGKVGGIGIHSTRGIPGGKDRRPQRVLPGRAATSTGAEANARYWYGNDGQAATALIVDFDCDVICTCDMYTTTTFHMGGPNDTTSHYTVGIEIVQGARGSAHVDADGNITGPITDDDYAYFYADQIATAVALTTAVREHPLLAIQPMIQAPYHGSAHPIKRLQTETDWSGVICHRDQTSGRGAGDPGDAVLAAFLAAGYEGVDYAAGGDVALWKPRQEALNVKLRAASLPLITADGHPRLKTAAAITALYGPATKGMWNRIPKPALPGCP